MKVQFFSGKTIAWFQRKVVHFYNQLKVQKLKYCIVSLLFLLICGGFYVRGLRQGYVRGGLLNMKISSILKANMDVGILKLLDKNDYASAKRVLRMSKK